MQNEFSGVFAVVVSQISMDRGREAALLLLYLTV